MPRSAEAWNMDFLASVRNDPILSKEFSPVPGAVVDPGEVDRWLWRWSRIRAGADSAQCKRAAGGAVTIWRSVGGLVDPDGTVTERLDAEASELWVQMGEAAAAASPAVDACADQAR